MFTIFFGHHYFLHFGASFLDDFPFSIRTSFGMSFNEYLLVVHSFFKSEFYLIFSVLILFIWKCFCFALILKLFHWIWSWFFLTFWRYIPMSSDFCCCCWKISCQLIVISLKINLSFLLPNFKIPSFSDVMNFHYEVTKCGFHLNFLA